MVTNLLAAEPHFQRVVSAQFHCQSRDWAASASLAGSGSTCCGRLGAPVGMILREHHHCMYGDQMELPSPSPSSCGGDLLCYLQWQELAVELNVAVVETSTRIPMAHRDQACADGVSELCEEGLRESTGVAELGKASFSLQGPM